MGRDELFSAEDPYPEVVVLHGPEVALFRQFLGLRDRREPFSHIIGRNVRMEYRSKSFSQVSGK